MFSCCIHFPPTLFLSMDYLETDYFGFKSTLQPERIVELLVNAYQNLQGNEQLMTTANDFELINQMTQLAREQNTRSISPETMKGTQDVFNTLSSLQIAVQHTEEASQELQFRNSSLQQQLDQVNHKLSVLQQSIDSLFLTSRTH